MRVLFSLSFLLFLAITSFSQQDVSLMTYNLLNFSSNNSSEKQNAAATVINHVNPDILVAQELSGDDPHLVLYNLLNQTEYGVGDYIKGYNSNKAIFYKKSKFSFISNTPINTALRDINEFKLLSLYTGDTIRVYAVHLQASSGSDKEALRLAEVKLLRGVTDALPQGTIFFVCGDFNIYKSYEPGYQELLSQTKTGYFIDPISMTGSFGQTIYSAFHTQSSRKDGFGGGGIDDRFDMVLHSQAVQDGVKASYVSTEVIGNDANHYDQAVNLLPNNSAPANVIQALFDASDHLPAVARYQLKKSAGDTTLSTSNTDTTVSATSGEIIITEFATEGAAEWVEIYNASGTTLNLADYAITQYSGAGPSLSTKYNLDPTTAGTTLSAGEYAVIIDDGDLEESFTTKWVDFPFSKAIVVKSFSLSNGSTGDEIIIIKTSNDSIVDEVNWLNSTELKEFTGGTLPNSSSGFTAARNTLKGISDNVANWNISDSIGSPGKANFVTTDTVVDVKNDSTESTKGNLIITEFSSEGLEDWVEIYNASGKTLNLGDYAITQYSGTGPSLSVKYNLDPSSSGRTIAPGEYVTIIDDGELELSFKTRWPDFPFTSSIVVFNLILTSTDEIIITNTSNDTIVDMIGWANSTELKAFSGGVLPNYASSQTAVRNTLDGVSTNPSNWNLSSQGTPGVLNSITTNVSNILADKENLEKQFLMYPNPSSGKVFLKLKTTLNKSLSIKVFDLRGVLIISQAFNGYSVLDLNHGFYTVNLYKNAEYITSKKLVVN